MKKKASAKKATATKEATKKDTASAKPADTAKVGSKDERTSPPSKKAKRRETKRTDDVKPKPGGSGVSSRTHSPGKSTKSRASSSLTPSRSRNSDKDRRGPSRSPPQAPGGPRLLNEEKSLCLLRGFLALETLRDHLLLLILLVVAIPVSPQEGIKSCLLPGDHPGIVHAAPPSSSHCAHYSPHYNRHRQSHVKSPDHPNCFAGNCNSELDDLRFQEWANEASANLPTLNWSLPVWK